MCSNVFDSLLLMVKVNIPACICLYWTPFNGRGVNV